MRADNGRDGAGTCDVFIAGAGIVACTFARILADEGLRVVLADAGAQHSLRPGENLKNFPNYQGDVDQFGGIVRGLMHPVSVAPVDGQAAYTRNALNPRQDPNKNLDGGVVAYAVGGMAIHWTCAIPRHHETFERIQFIPREDWEALYGAAEGLLRRHTDVHTGSLRHQVLKRVLARHEVRDTPLAAERLNDTHVHYTGADTVLGSYAEHGANGRLSILPEHRVSHLLYAGGRVNAAVVRDLRTKEEKIVYADAFVVAAGWVHTAQLLWNSWIRPRALGRYLSDHTFSACQVVLKPEIVDQIAAEIVPKAAPAGLSAAALPIPMNDPPPHMYIPVADGRLWHGQIFREAFQFDPLSPRVDSRLIVDLKWFGMIDPVESNLVRFESDIMDRTGLPQPTFEFALGPGDRERQDMMTAHMREVARDLGEYLPGSEPRHIPLGASTHTMGSTRMGAVDDGTSVADPHAKVWGFDNLYLGGNCVIPTRNASNPTLTSVALAIRASRHLLSGGATVRTAQGTQPDTAPSPATSTASTGDPVLANRVTG